MTSPVYLRARLSFAHRFLWILVLFALSRPHPLTAQTQAQDICTIEPPGSTYRLIAGDQKDSRHLQLERDFHAKGPLEINICAGEVRILPSQDGHLHVNIALSKDPASDITVFMRQIESDEHKTIVSIAYPKDLSPSITVRIPPTAPLQSLINLGTGDLNLRGDAIRGDRQIQVGTGTATLYLREDSEYSVLQTSIGIGNLHDRRQGGASTHLVASKRVLPGKGDGKIALNVGVGSVELRPEE